MLFLAMSCLQARTQSQAYTHLLELNPDGIQLTPGNYPTENFQKSVNIPYRFHHGFSWTQYRRDVYNENYKPIDIEYNHSIHPPKIINGVSFEEWIENAGDYIYETMYPGYYLGTGSEIEAAMLAGKRLAVDISHLYIQKFKNVISDSIIKKLFSYDKVSEIHVSFNEGKYDSHLQLTETTPFISEIKGREIVVYESYLHKLSLDERKQQIDLVRKFL